MQPWRTVPLVENEIAVIAKELYLAIQRHNCLRPRHQPREPKWISRQHGFVPENARIAACKEHFGLAALATATNESPRAREKIAPIKQTFLL